MDMQDITTGSAQATHAETARRWSRLVLAYGAPGADALLDHVPEHIRRPVDPTARRERSRIDTALRREAGLTGGLLTAVLGGAAVAGSTPLAVAAGVVTVAAVPVVSTRWWRLAGRRKALTPDAGHQPWELTRFSRWLVARAHQATVRAAEVDGGPSDTADRMAEALYRFTDDVRTLERVIASSAAVADTYGRLRRVRDHRDQVDALLATEAHVLHVLELFETTAQEVVLAARAERAGGEPAGVVPSLLDLQAEALARSAALAALDDLEP